MAKDIQCCFAVHVDAVAGWLGSYGGEDSPADISRGMFAGESLKHSQCALSEPRIKREHVVLAEILRFEHLVPLNPHPLIDRRAIEHVSGAETVSRDPAILTPYGDIDKLELVPL